MKNRKAPFVQIGIPSLLVIFILLCLVTFAALSYVTAANDYSLSQKTAERISDYYAADAKARETLAAMIQDAGQTPDTDSLSFSVPIDEKQSLAVEAVRDGDSFTVTRWQVVTEGEWNPDDSLPVFQ